jgi:hypothetical protein
MKPKEKIAQRIARAVEDVASAEAALQEASDAFQLAKSHWESKRSVVDRIYAATTATELEEALDGEPAPADVKRPTKKPAKQAKKKPSKKQAQKTAEVEELAKKVDEEEVSLCEQELAMLNTANESGVLDQINPPWVRRQLQRKELIEEAREGTGGRKRFYRLTQAGRKLMGWAPVLTPVAVNESATPPARDYPAKKAKPADEDEVETDRELVLGPFAVCSPKAELGESIEYVLREAGFADKPLQTVVDAFNGADLITLADIREAVEAEKTDAREYFRPAFARVCIEYGLDPLWESIERGIRKYLKDLYSA